MIETPDVGFWAGVGSAIATIGAILYGVMRRRVTDIQSDTRVGAEETLVRRLQGVVESQEKRIDQLSDRIDKMAEERNRVLVENAKLTTIVDHLNKELAEHKSEVAELRGIIDRRNLKDKIKVSDNKIAVDDLYPNQPDWKPVAE